MYFFLILPMFLCSISNQKQTYIRYRTSPSFGWFTLNNAQLSICFEAQLTTIINLSWSVLPEWSNANDNLKTLRTLARNFPNIHFFLKMLPLKDVRNAKRRGVTGFVLERACPEEHLNLSESGFVSEEGHSPKILQLELWREIFSAKYDLWSDFSQLVRFLKEQVRI